MLRVLLADDDVLFVQLLKQKLNLFAYDVIDVGDGESAVRAAEQYLPDVIVLDTFMPVLDGFEALEQIRKIESLMKVPVFMMTAVQHKEQVKQLVHKSINGYLLKPFYPDQLVSAFNILNVAPQKLAV